MNGYRIDATYLCKDGELVTFSKRTGEMLYFSKDVAAIFEFFRSSRPLQHLLEAVQEEKRHFQAFLGLLIEKGLLVPAACPAVVPGNSFICYSKPQLLRISSKSVAELARLCGFTPPSTSNTGN